MIRRGAQAMYKRGAAVTPLGRNGGGAQAKLYASHNKTIVQILHKQCSTPMSMYKRGAVAGGAGVEVRPGRSSEII